MKSSALDLPPLPQGGGEDQPLQFGEWLQLSSCIVADVSESSLVWWGLVRSSTEEAYKQWLKSDLLSRASIVPDETHTSSARWTHLNSMVAGMLLAVMTPSLRADLIARQEVGSSVKILYRLFLHFQPAGSGEKEVILKRLHAPQQAKSSAEAQQILRNWARWEARAREIGLILPDPSILVRALTAVMSQIMATNQDLAFKMNVARQALRLEQSPTLDKVMAHHRHALAEVDSLVINQGGSSGAALRLINNPAPVPKASTKPLCKYFLSEKGCKKSKCGYQHDMSGLEKAARSRKCLRCGSEAHRAKECPLAKGQKRGDGTDPGSPSSQRTPASPVSPTPASTSAAQSLFSMELSGPTGQAPVLAVSGQVPNSAWQLAQVPGTLPSGQALGQAPNSALQSVQVPGSTLPLGQVSGQVPSSALQLGQSPALPSGHKSGQPAGLGATLLDTLLREAGIGLSPQGGGSSAALNVMQLETGRSRTGAEKDALADSGATHALRPPKSKEEWTEAATVSVKLAGSQETTLKLSPGGSLRIQVRNPQALIGPKVLK